MRAWWRRRREGREHPAPTTLSRYLDGDVADREREAVDRHVSGCGPCRRFLESLSQTIGGLGLLRSERSPVQADRVIATLRPADDRGAIVYCLRRSQLRLTVPTGVVVGTVLSFLNKGGMLLDGNIDLAMCAICAADYVLPFAAMTLVLLTAARVARSR